MATTVTIPTTADLPKDWKTTVGGIIAAIVTLGQLYLMTGHITWWGALIAVAIAVVGYYLPKKPSAQDELELQQKMEKVVQDLISKQPIGPDVNSLVTAVTTQVMNNLAPQQASVDQPAKTE